MPANRRRRQSPISGGGSASWTTTYGDLVTLLLCFFVMLFAFSSFDNEKFQSIISAFQSALGVLDGGTSIVSEPGLTGASSPEAELLRRTLLQVQDTQVMMNRLSAFQANNGLEMAFSLESVERGVIIHFTDRVLFDLGKAALKPEAKEVLRALAEELKMWGNHIRVEGHTDNLPIRTAPYPSNWELSTARATEVLRYLIEVGGLAPERLSAAGYGEYRPIASNETEEGRARNRRVDIVLLRSGLELSEPTAALRIN